MLSLPLPWRFSEVSKYMRAGLGALSAGLSIRVLKYITCYGTAIRNGSQTNETIGLE